jgi:hypothetical protein
MSILNLFLLSANISIDNYCKTDSLYSCWIGTSFLVSKLKRYILYSHRSSNLVLTGSGECERQETVVPKNYFLNYSCELFFNVTLAITLFTRWRVWYSRAKYIKLGLLSRLIAADRDRR